MQCSQCNKSTNSLFNGICLDCDKSNRAKRLQDMIDLVKSPKDLEGWKPEDMVKAFVKVFLSYQKEPTKEKIETIACLYYWAVHAQRTVSATIHEIFEWQEFHLNAERKKFN